MTQRGVAEYPRVKSSLRHHGSSRLSGNEGSASARSTGLLATVNILCRAELCKVANGMACLSVAPGTRVISAQSSWLSQPFLSLHAIVTASTATKTFPFRRYPRFCSYRYCRVTNATMSSEKNRLSSIPEGPEPHSAVHSDEEGTVFQDTSAEVSGER